MTSTHGIGHDARDDLPDASRSDLPEPLRASVLAGAEEASIMSLEAAERRLISQALRQTNGNQSRAAELLTIERHRLRRKIVRYGLEDLTHPQPQ